MTDRKLLNRKIKLWTQRGFFYCGEVVDENDTHIWIHDDKKDAEFMIQREWATEIQFLEGGEDEDI